MMEHNDEQVEESSINRTSSSRSCKVLWGRHNEIARLRKIWTESTRGSCCCDGSGTGCSPQLVLITGPAGVGKRSLVQTTLPPIVEEMGGIFVSQRFKASGTATTLNNPENRQSCVTTTSSSSTKQAVSSSTTTSTTIWLNVVRDIVQSIDHEIKVTLRNTILPQHFSLPSDWQMLKELLTPLGFVLSSDKDATATSGMSSTKLTTTSTTATTTTSVAPFAQGMMKFAESSSRSSAMVLARFIYAISTCIPIALFLDQGIYADTLAFDVIKTLLFDDNNYNTSPPQTRQQSKGLLIVLSYRAGDPFDVPAPPPDTLLGEFLASCDGMGPMTASSAAVLRKNDSFPTIHLGNLAREAVNEWIREYFSGEEMVEDIADIVYDVGEGNALLTKLLLRYLQLEAAQFLSGNGEEIESIRRFLPESGGTRELYKCILSCQQELVRTIVMTAAALCEVGDDAVRCDVLEMIFQQPCGEALASAKECELLLPDKNRWRFMSSDLQSTAYNTIAESDRPLTHLRIGRRIWKNSTLGSDRETADDASLLCIVVKHLQRGASLVTDEEERKTMAQICWRAGVQAMGSSTFPCAAQYFDLGICVLGENLWQPNLYDVSLVLHNCAAEAYYCTGNFDATDRMINMVFANARSFNDKLQAYTTLIFAQGACHRLKVAVETALDVLHQLGEPIPSKPKKLTVLVEFLKTRKLLRGRTDRFFLNIPAATEADDVTAMVLLCFAFYYTYLTNPELGLFVLFRMIRRSVERGMSGPAIVAYSAYATVLCSLLGQVDEGYRFGQIALALLDQYAAQPWLPRVQVMIHGIVNIWICPLRDGLQPLLSCQRTALRSGDIETSVNSATMYFFFAFHVGIQLPFLEREAGTLCRTMETYSQTTGLLFLLPLWNLFSDLSCIDTLRLSTSSEIFDWKSVLRFCDKEGDNLAAFQCYISRVMFSCLVGDYHESLEMASKARSVAFDADFGLEFYEGLSALAISRSTGCMQRRKLISTGRRSIKQIQRWGRKCPANSRNKQALLEAELAALRGRPLAAHDLYNESIQGAKREGFIHEEGLAYERLAQYHCSLGHPHLAVPFFKCARLCYDQWGATILVRRIDELIANNTT